MKTLAQYLADHGGDHEAAARALHTDLLAADQRAEQEAGENIRARTISKAAAPLLEAAGVFIPPAGQRPTQDAASALDEGVQKAVQGWKGMQGSIKTLEDFAAATGLDMTAYQAATSPEQAQKLLKDFAGSLGGTRTALDTTTQELNAYRFATDNGLKPAAVLLQKGLEQLQLREVPGPEKDGKPTTVKVWQVPGKAEGEYVAALDHLSPVMESLKVAPTVAGTAWVGGQESQGDGAPRSPFASIRPAVSSGQQAPAPVSPFAFPTGGKSA